MKHLAAISETKVADIEGYLQSMHAAVGVFSSSSAALKDLIEGYSMVFTGLRTISESG